MRLQELRVVVTGAAQGMGRHFALRLAQAGAYVVAADLNESGLLSLVQEARDLPGRVFPRRLNVVDEQACAQTAAWAFDTMGGLNALINNAGVLRDGLLVKRDPSTGAIVRMPREDWDTVLAVNLTGATMMMREWVATLLAHDQRPAVAVNISSLARHGNRGQSSYVAAKAALAANTRTWASEFAPYGIRVGAVAPGLVETPMTASMSSKAREALVARVPVGRIATAEDIWLAVRFVFECDYFNGRCVDVDGGLTM